MLSARTFGKYVPNTERARGGQSMGVGVFTRGLQMGGTVWTFKFANGYGASVINDGYGGESGLYELAVLGLDGRLNYGTPVTDDVVGWLSEEQVAETLGQIEALNPEVIAAAAAEKARIKRDERIAELRAELTALEAEADVTP